MPRIDKINDELRSALSELLRQAKDPRITGIISVTRVDATGDLKHAKVYVSVLPEETAESVLRGLSSASGFLRRELSKLLTIRQVPELQFIRDTSIAHGAHINKLISELETETTPNAEKSTDSD
ncbi:30S ribosome-binding factor RbfA [Oscillospiraceae bacterium OttesenSCG-928-G22]|nr:30S ribosome-binding factor RbfA [Oscillospiraceae bacterium OttesenSCG-928-G22]